METSNRKSRGYRIAALLFSLSGLIWVIRGVIGGNIGLYIPIGMMNVCVGMMFLSMSRRAKNHQTKEPPRNSGA